MAHYQEDSAATAFLGRMAHLLDAPDDLDETLDRIVRLAPQTVQGTDRVAITVLRPDGTVDTAAASDDRVAKLDQLQTGADDGPSMSALHGESLVRIDDMATDRRWPRFAEAARDLGIHSMLACRIRSRKGTRAALNFHGNARDSFDESAARTATLYTAFASIAMGNAELMESLRRSATSRQLIGEATGILVERHHLTSEQAFERLVRASQHTNVKLRNIAEFVVLTGEEPQRFGSRA